MPENRTTYLKAVSLRVVVVSFGFGEKVVVVMKSEVPLVVRKGTESGRVVDALGRGQAGPEQRQEKKKKQNSHSVSTPWRTEQM